MKYIKKDGSEIRISVVDSQSTIESKIIFTIKNKNKEVKIIILENGEMNIDGKIIPPEMHMKAFRKIRKKITECQNYRTEQEKKEAEKILENLDNF